MSPGRFRGVRLLPSVASQVGAVLVLAVVLAHLVTSLAFLGIVGGESMESDPLVAAGRIAGLVQALDRGFDPGGGGSPVVRRVAEVPEGSGLPVERGISWLVGRILDDPSRVLPAPEGLSPPGMQTVLVRAPSGAYLFTVPARSFYQSPLIFPWLSSLAALLVGGVLLVSYAVRWITSPIAAVARATRGFGGQAGGPDLPVGGPREVAELASAFNAMRGRVAALVEERTRMLAAVSHDLRTPLTRLRLRAEMAPDGPLRQAVVREVERLDALLEEALVFASPVRTGAPEVIDLGSLVATACSEYADLGRDVAYVGPRRLVALAGEVGIARIVANLVDNGLRHGNAVVVSLSRKKDVAVIEVGDDGPGIPEALRPRAFEPFYTTDGARPRGGQGFGLGLSIVRDLALGMGGDVSLGEAAAGGLSVRVELPVLRCGGT